MKGIVFTEFLEMVEEDHGYEMVDKIIESSDLESNGIYTSIGTYPHSEMVKLLIALNKETRVPLPDLLHKFGRYLFETFKVSYPLFFSGFTNSFDFLNTVENYIHVEVLKLYPDAQLPTFQSEMNGENQMRMVYSSERKMSSLALGLIEKAVEHFQEDAKIEMKNMEEDGSKVLFIITRV
jgi:hypothetical protein